MEDQPDDTPESPEPLELRVGNLAKDAHYTTKATKARIKQKSGHKKGAEIGTILKVLESESGGLLGMLSNRLKKAVLRVPDEYLRYDEDQLVAKLKEEFNYVASPTTEALRNNFWMEFDRCQIVGASTLQETSVWRGACAESYWNALLESPDRWHIIAFIVTKPIAYEVSIHSLLNLATRKIREILMIPLKNEKGEIRDSKTLDVILKAAAMVDMRAKGGYVQKAETKNLTVMSSHSQLTYTGSIDISKKPIDQLTSDEIQKRLDILNTELAAYEQKKLPIQSDSLPTTPVQVNAIGVAVPDPIDMTPRQTKTVERSDEQF